MDNIGYCGDDCNQCPRYLATQSGDEERFKKVAEMWRTVGWRYTLEPPQKQVCYGCDSLEICEPGIRDCVMAKGLDSCGKCADYPCEKLVRIFENNRREAAICKKKFSKEDYEIFQRAFFDKKKRLDEMHRSF
ncbi:MAG: DUF3795 domain-containing protein [Dehalococcoidales bacterium]|nr:DUF3795 domain-containing protein [Dehalococcoidales bacterium]